MVDADAERDTCDASALPPGGGTAIEHEVGGGLTTVVLLHAPHHVLRVLVDVLEHLGLLQVAVCK